MSREAEEGWEWILIQSDPCPQCAMNPSGLPEDQLGSLAVHEAHAWMEFLGGADDTALRISPGEGIFSPIEYGAHSRDMLRVFGDRIVAALEFEDPVVDWFDHDSASKAHNYPALAVDALGNDLLAQAERLQGILGRCQGADWQRTARRDGTDRFTVAGMACFAIHEVHHHLLDAKGEITA